MFEDLLLTEPVVTALRVAATGRGGRPLGTTGVLMALLRTDATSPWHYVALHTGDYDQLEPARQDDPGGGETAGRWEGVPLTPALTAALDYAAELALGYNMLPVPTSLLALALVAEPDSGATRTMRAGTDLSHRDLVELIHEHLLGDRLVDSPIFPPWARSGEVPVPEAAALPGPPADEPVVDWAGAGAGAFELMRAAVRRADEPLRERLAVVVLGDDEAFSEVRDEIADLVDEPAAAVVDRARDRFDTHQPNPAQILAAATVEPSEKVRRFCGFLGLDPSEIAAVASAHALEDQARSGVSVAGMAVLTASVAIHLALTGMVIAHVVETGQWLQLPLAWLVWTGHPSTSVRGTLVMVPVVGWILGPVAAGLQLLTAILDVPYARAERLAFWGQSGVRLSLRSYRRHVIRLKGWVPAMQAYRQRNIFLRRLAKA